MNEEELKKGCGKEAGFITFTDDFGNKDGDVMLCGDTTKKINGEIELFLCDTCQARLEGFQKGKLEERKKIKNIIDNILIRKRSYCREYCQKFFLEDMEELKRLIDFEEQLQKEIGDNSQQPRMKQTRGGELKSDEGLHSTDNGSPADTFSREESEDICICGHHTKDHSYDPNKLDADLECDICDCKGFKTKEDRGFLGGYAEFWDNPEDDRWDKEYNPDLLPETLKNKEEKQDENS